jgi:AAA+ superfamily predicted ATPase
MPLPDDAGRLGLIRLYGRDLELRLEDPDTVVRRTAGVTASFIKELMRKAALIAALEADGTGAPTITDAHVGDALDELLSDERDDPGAPRWRRHVVPARQRMAPAGRTRVTRGVVRPRST